MRSFPSEERSKGSPEWNHYHIEAKDGVLRLSVNGKEVSGGEKCNWRKGYLALESEGAPVEWRNLRVKELPSSGAKPEESAPEAQGHRALYNGVDLRGWTTKSPEQWKVNDWRLIQSSGTSSDEKPAMITTVEKFADCEIIFDLRFPKDAPKNAMAIAQVRSNFVPFRAKPGEWQRVVIKVKGNTMTYSDGSETWTDSDFSPGFSEGPFGLGGNGTVEFANIYVREP
jgi:Domain of Unknown Function (DUF1080)